MGYGARGFWAFAAFILATALTPTPGWGEAPDARPFFLAISHFGANGAAIDPGDTRLSPAEEAQFAAVAHAMAFPRYLYSGCDDRAHAAYLLLPAALRDK